MRKSPSVSSEVRLLETYGPTNKQPETPVPRVKGGEKGDAGMRFENPRPMNWSKMRLETDIRADLAQQLEEMYARWPVFVRGWYARSE